MAGTVATIIGLELAKQYNDKAITKALRAYRNHSEVRVQPIDGVHAYLVVKNKLKADAEKDLMGIIKSFKSFGGQEFDSTVLVGDVPKPAMARINNDMVRNAPPLWEQNGMTKEAWDAATLERLNA